MSRGDEHRHRARPGPQRGADRFAVDRERRGSPTLVGRHAESAGQHAFRTANGRSVEPEAGVTREAEPAGVRQPPRVEQDKVRSRRQPRERVEKDGQLAEREQPRDVRKGSARSAPDTSNTSSDGSCYESGRRVEPAVREEYATSAPATQAGLRHGDDAHLATQPLLNRQGLLHRGLRVVQRSKHHPDYP